MRTLCLGRSRGCKRLEPVWSARDLAFDVTANGPRLATAYPWPWGLGWEACPSELREVHSPASLLAGLPRAGTGAAAVGLVGTPQPALTENYQDCFTVIQVTLNTLGISACSAPVDVLGIAADFLGCGLRQRWFLRGASEVR